MKSTLKYSLLLTAGAAMLLCAGNLSAQNRPPGGNFDPAQMRQQMLDSLRERFGVKDDTEWKLIGDRIEKVMEAQRATRTGMGGMGGRGGPGGPRGGGQGGPGGPGGGGRQPGGGDNGGGDNQPRGNRGGPGGPGGFGGPGGQPSPEVEALQKAIEADASADEIKAKLERLRDSRKAVEEKLEKAQQDLREVLSIKQEAIAVMFGFLK